MGATCFVQCCKDKDCPQLYENKMKTEKAKSEKNPHGIVVGQKLYYVPAHTWSGEGREVKVDKVATKWIYCGARLRIDLKNLMADGEGYGTAGRCYLSKEIYDKKIRLDKMWSDVHKLFNRQYSRPSHITERDIIDLTAIMENQKRINAKC